MWLRPKFVFGARLLGILRSILKVIFVLLVAYVWLMTSKACGVIDVSSDVIVIDPVLDMHVAFRLNADLADVSS